MAAVAAVTLAIAIVPLGCGSDDSNDGPTPTPTPTTSGGATPTPTPLPSPTVVVLTLVESTGTASTTLDLGASGDAFLLAYEGGAIGTATAIYGVRFGTDGRVVDASPFLVSVPQGGGYLADPSWTNPAVAFDGSVYGVAYAGTGTVQGSIPGAAITAVQVGVDGSVGFPVDLAETAQIGTCESNVVPPPAIAASSATSFAALWPLEEGCAGGPVLSRLDGAFAVVQGEGFAVSEIDGLLPPVGDQTVVSSPASVASSGTTTVGAWTEMVAGANTVTVEVAVLSSGGVERVALADAADALVRPAIATDGRDYLVVWFGTGGTVRGARFRPGTGPLDGPDGFVIAVAQTATEPVVAFGDGRYVVVWTVVQGSGAVSALASEVSPAGIVTPFGALAGDVGSRTSVAFARGRFAIAYERSSDPGSIAAALFAP